MLASRPLLGRLSIPRHAPSTRRFFIQSLCNGYLDLAIALPFPPSFPPYSTTIILVTVVTRLALLPISIWVRSMGCVSVIVQVTSWRRVDDGRARSKK